MMTERLDCSLAHFQILADGVVFRDVGFCFVAHAFINSALSGDRCLPRRFGTTTCFLEVATMFRLKLSHLGREFALAQFVTGAFLELGYVGRLLFRQACAFSAHLSL